MNLLRFSSAIQATSCSCAFSLDNASPPSLRSICKPSVVCILRPSCSANSCSKGVAAYSVTCNLVPPFAARPVTPRFAGSGETKNGDLSKETGLRISRTFDYAKSPVCWVLEPRIFLCAALGKTNSGEPEFGEQAEVESASNEVENKDGGLVSGSPIVIVEAPAMLKTAEPMPMMRPNRGLLKPGDAGRVIDRRPKNLWAVRFAVGAYLIERKCFEPIDPQ